MDLWQIWEGARGRGGPAKKGSFGDRLKKKKKWCHWTWNCKKKKSFCLFIYLFLSFLIFAAFNKIWWFHEKILIKKRGSLGVSCETWRGHLVTNLAEKGIRLTGAWRSPGLSNLRPTGHMRPRRNAILCGPRSHIYFNSIKWINETMKPESSVLIWSAQLILCRC